MEVWLRMPYKVRSANRLGPESWLAVGDYCWQALTGVDIGQVLSFESCAIGVSTVSLLAEDNTNSHGNGKRLFGPTESETLHMCPYTSCTEPGRSWSYLVGW